MTDKLQSSERRRCCICGKQILPSDVIVEERPSGNAGGVESWSYCLSCWFGMTQLRQRELHLENLLKELDL